MNCSDSSLSFRMGLKLLDNAFSFIESAIVVLKRFETDSYSYDNNELRSAILSAATGVEVILKAKIAAQDWRELFQFIHKADRNKLLSGEFYSVKLEDCISRIEKLYSFQITLHYKGELDRIRQIRNKLVHFYYDFDRNEFMTLVATCIDIFIEFYKEFIEAEFYEEYDRTSKIDNTLKYVEEYVSIRLKSAGKRLEVSVRPLTYHLSECGSCGQDTYVIRDNKEICCLFCGLSYMIEEKAEEWSENRQNKKCSHCHVKSMFSNSGNDC